MLVAAGFFTSSFSKLLKLIELYELYKTIGLSYNSAIEFK